MREKRTGQVISIGTAIAERFAEGTDYASWTDEDWAAQDARVRKSKDDEKAAAEADRIRNRWPELLDAGFPRRAVEAAKRADEKRPSIAKVAAWDARAHSVLVISGPARCGKTVTATWWAARQESVPAFVRATTFAASSRYDRDTRASWFDAPALVLDDLGSEYLDAKGSFLVDLDELVDVFYGDLKPLLITTNCKVEQIKSRYGERVRTRLRECGRFWSTDQHGQAAP
jgi:hypothetical protein